MPWPWDIARYCLELPSSAIKHFPAGTYNEQVATWPGRIELSLMDIVHQAWYMFKHLNLGQWGEGELRFAKWMAEEKPPVEGETRLLDDLIADLWGASWYALRLAGRRDA
jgi:hypothetical protein